MPPLRLIKKEEKKESLRCPKSTTLEAASAVTFKKQWNGSANAQQDSHSRTLKPIVGLLSEKGRKSF